MSEKPKRKAKRKKDAELTFERALARLEEIAEQLESGDASLEQAIALAEEGYQLSQFCEKQLTAAEGKVQKLVERMGGISLEPLEAEAEEDEEEE